MMKDLIGEVAALLEANGCDCDCECAASGYESHESDCEVCLACRICDVLMRHKRHLDWARGEDARSKERRAPVQRDKGMPPGSVLWSEHTEAWNVYAKKYGYDQTAERIAERGGFGYSEMRDLLGHEPKSWIAWEARRDEYEV